jgi:hypothetical protein
MYILLNPNTDSSILIPWIKFSFFKSGMGRHSLEVLCYVYTVCLDYRAGGGGGGGGDTLHSFQERA